MDNISNIFPILIMLVVFIVKIVSESKKKQKQAQEQAYKRTGSMQNSPNQYSQKIETSSTGSSTDWEQSRTNENDYRSLDPNYIPKAMPDIDYDKMTNVTLQPSQDDIKSIPLTTIVREDNKRLISIREKMRNANTVKDIYLFSEIFNKPKAHRKWQRSIY